MSGSSTGLQGEHFSKLCLKSPSLVFFGKRLCVSSAGHTATPHCFAHPAKLKSVKEVKFFFASYSGLPPPWVTAADMAHVHHLLKHNLSNDSSADVAQTQRTFDESLQLIVIVEKILKQKLCNNCGIIWDEWTSFSLFIHFTYWQLRVTDDFQLRSKDQF